MKRANVSPCATVPPCASSGRTARLARYRGAATAAVLYGTAACHGELVTLGQQPVTTSDDSEPTTSVPVDAGNNTTSAPIDAADTTSAPVETGVTTPAPGDAGSSTSAVVDAGDTTSDTQPFRAPRVLTPVIVPVIGSEDKDDNPTLTNDMLEIYFTSTRSGNSDVWFARRDSADVDFNAPEPLSIVNSSEFESSPAVDGDGLTLWVARRADDGMGGLDIYASRRPSRTDAWGAPELVVNLNTAGDDLPRPPGAGGLIMPLSVRTEGDTYQLYLATRPDTSSEFEPAMPLEGLRREGYGSVDGFISWSGGHLLFAYTRDEAGDLFIAAQGAPGFANAIPLLDVNTDADERDPWLSPDGKFLYFASDRDETLRLYSAELEWE